MTQRQTFTAGQVLTAAQLTTLQDTIWTDDVNAQVGTTYTLLLTDAGKQITMSNQASSVLTVPPNSSVAFTVGTRIQVIQLGEGIVTVTAGSGTTFTSLASSFAMTRYQVATLIKTATNTWVVSLSSAGTSATTANNALKIGGRTVFVQQATPTALAVGDIWFQVTGIAPLT